MWMRMRATPRPPDPKRQRGFRRAAKPWLSLLLLLVVVSETAAIATNAADKREQAAAKGRLCLRVYYMR